jgi:hypothetical protein
MLPTFTGSAYTPIRRNSRRSPSRSGEEGKASLSEEQQRRLDRDRAALFLRGVAAQGDGPREFYVHKLDGGRYAAA